ncbi:MAG: hypothetical protein ABIT16_10790 [Croceibacterium sp.]
MSIVTIIIALVVVFIAWKVLTGVLKIGAILAVVLLAAYLLSRGGLG